MTVTRTTTLTVFLVFVFNSIVLANNNLFLPGDAFFPSKMTADEMATFVDSPNEHVFKYNSYGGYGAAFCGYAGYASAQLPEVDAAFAANLKSAYEKVREFNPRELIEIEEEDDDGNGTGVFVLQETNPVGVMFYNDAFDFEKFKLALRYNENWVKDSTSFGHSAEHVRLLPSRKQQQSVRDFMARCGQS